MATTSDSLSATGSVVLTLNKDGVPDTQAIVTIRGTFGTVTGVIEGSIDGTYYFGLAALNRQTNVWATSTLSPSDNTGYSWLVDCAGFAYVRFRVTAIASGTVNVAIASNHLPTSPLQTPVGSSFQATTFSGDLTLSGGSDLVFSGATGENQILMTDNLASALKIAQSSNAYMTFVTTDSAEKIVANKSLDLADAATLAAAGSAQGDAAAIVNQITFVSAADGTTGVVLPAAVAGLVRLVYNLHASNGLKVYPASGDDINDGSANAAVTIEGKTLAIFVALDATTWAAIFTANS